MKPSLKPFSPDSSEGHEKSTQGRNGVLEPTFNVGHIHPASQVTSWQLAALGSCPQGRAARSSTLAPSCGRSAHLAKLAGTIQHFLGPAKWMVFLLDSPQTNPNKGGLKHRHSSCARGTGALHSSPVSGQRSPRATGKLPGQTKVSSTWEGAAQGEGFPALQVSCSLHRGCRLTSA